MAMALLKHVHSHYLTVRCVESLLKDLQHSIIFVNLSIRLCFQSFDEELLSRTHFRESYSVSLSLRLSVSLSLCLFVSLVTVVFTLNSSYPDNRLVMNVNYSNVLTGQG